MNLFAEYAPAPGGAPKLTRADGLEVRPARDAEIEAAARLALAREGGALDEHLARFERTAREMEAGRALFLVAALGEEVLGFGRVIHHRPPPDAPPCAAPEGWYLAGVLVAPGARRRGLGTQLTRERLDWVARRSASAYYFVNARNQASIALHTRFGFVEKTRRFSFPGVTFQGGSGVLFEKRFDGKRLDGRR